MAESYWGGGKHAPNGPVKQIIKLQYKIINMLCEYILFPSLSS